MNSNKPWVSILFQPRQTMRGIIDKNPAYLVIVLAAATGAFQFFLRFWGFLTELNFPLVTTIFLPLVVGAVLGLVFIYFFGWLYRLVGSWLGGQATSAEVRAALAWARMPILFVVLPSVALFLVLPNFIFIRVLVVIGTLAAGVWAFVLTCKTLGEVHRFSSWRGFGTLAITNCLILLPIIVVTVRIGLIMPAATTSRERAYEAAAIGHVQHMVNALEFYKMDHQGKYPGSMKQLVEENYLDVEPYGAISEHKVHERYRYRFAESESSDSPYPIEAQRATRGGKTAAVLTLDEEMRLFADGELRTR